MPFKLDKWLIKLTKDIPFLAMETLYKQMGAGFHVALGAWWSCFFAHFCRISPWWYFSALGWIGYVIWSELVSDGHWKRIQLGIETEGDKKDMISDFITKLIGLVFYALALV